MHSICAVILARIIIQIKRTKSAEKLITELIKLIKFFLKTVEKADKNMLIKRTEMRLKTVEKADIISGKADKI